jgi:hypothetical protein
VSEPGPSGEGGLRPPGPQATASSVEPKRAPEKTRDGAKRKSKKTGKSKKPKKTAKKKTEKKKTAKKKAAKRRRKAAKKPKGTGRKRAK